MIKTLVISIILICLFINSHNVNADVVFNINHKELNPPSNSRSTISVKSKNLKMDYYEEEQKSSHSMIFRGDRKEMIVINHDEKSYMIMDQKTINSYAKQMNSAMAELEEKMKDLPPEQRAMMEKYMKGKMPMTDEPAYVEPVFKKTGNGKFNGYSCTKYEVYKGPEKVKEHCVTQWNKIKGGDEMYSTMLEWADFMDEWSKAFKSSGSFGSSAKFERNEFKELRKMNGFPIHTVNFDNGLADSESNLSSSEKISLNSTDFEPPAGYNRKNMGR